MKQTLYASKQCCTRVPVGIHAHATRTWWQVCGVYACMYDYHIAVSIKPIAIHGSLGQLQQQQLAWGRQQTHAQMQEYNRAGGNWGE